MVNNQPPLNDIENQQPIQTGIVAPQNLDTRFLWDFEKDRLEIEAKWRGCKLATDENRNYVFVPKPGARPIMTEEGINELMAEVYINVNKSTGSGNIDSDRVKEWCARKGRSLAGLIYTNGKKWGLDPTKWESVMDDFMVLYETNLTRSIGGRAMALAAGAENYTETKQVIGQPQQSGWLSKAFSTQKK